jgi:hypothetical protein
MAKVFLPSCATAAPLIGAIVPTMIYPPPSMMACTLANAKPAALAALGDAGALGRYAAWRSSSGTLAPTFHGSSWSARRCPQHQV